MKKKMTFKRSYRVTIGKNKQHIGWINSGEALDLAKLVKGVSADHSDSVGDLLTGEIEEIDNEAPLSSFHLVGAEVKGTPTFLGYLETTKPALADTLVRLWPQMQFAEVVK